MKRLTEPQSSLLLFLHIFRLLQIRMVDIESSTTHSYILDFYFPSDLFAKSISNSIPIFLGANIIPKPDALSGEQNCHFCAQHVSLPDSLFLERFFCSFEIIV